MALHNKSQACRVDILAMRLLEIFGLMGITVKKGVLDFYAHIFQGALSTTLTLMLRTLL